MDKTSTKGTTVNIRLPDDLRAVVDEKAREYRISRSAVIRLILVDYFKKSGVLDRQGEAEEKEGEING